MAEKNWQQQIYEGSVANNQRSATPQIATPAPAQVVYQGGIVLPTAAPLPRVDLTATEHFIAAETQRQKDIAAKKEADRAAAEAAILAEKARDDEAMKLPADLRAEYFAKKQMAAPIHPAIAGLVQGYASSI